MLVEFRCNNIEEDYIKVTKKTMKKSILWSLVLTAFLFIWGIYNIVNAEYFYAAVVMLIGIAIPVAIYFLIKSGMKKNIQTNKLYFGGSIYYRFEDEFFYQDCVNPLSRTTMQSRYETIYQVMESTEILSIYESAGSMFTLNKKDIVSGDINELINMLSYRLGKKYIRTK